MAEWIYEEGIGENRAALVEDDEILEAQIELPGALRAGSVREGRLTSILIPAWRGIVQVPGQEVLLEPMPGTLTEGQVVRVEIFREPIPEPGRAKLAKARVSNEPERDGPDLWTRIKSSGHRATRENGARPDRLEQAGWTELLEQAATGEISFPGGALRMSMTPAMALFDVDGHLPPAELAVAGARAAAQAIRRLGLAGSIGIDLPTLAKREERQAAAAVVDRIIPQPTERTAVNGFGFLQIVRRRERPSMPELVRHDPAGAAARALLRRAERARGRGCRTLRAAPAVVARIEANPQWIEELGRRAGAAVALQADPALAISAGHVQSEFQ